MNVWPRQNAHFEVCMQRRSKMDLNRPSQKTGRNAFSYEQQRQEQESTFIKNCFYQSKRASGRKEEKTKNTRRRHTYVNNGSK